jgi:phospholipase D-like protein
MAAVNPTLHAHGVWSRLTALARRSKGTAVAVPYFGSGASKLLPLKKGGTLVVRFDREAVRCGQVNPKEVIRLMKDGVEVHACANLHAKVFVFGNTAIVGSTNVSSSSANSLIEACVEVKARRFAATCKRFVESLKGDKVGLEFAKAMVPLYRPPQFVGSRRGKAQKSRRVLPKHSDLWLVSLVSSEWKEVDYEQEEAGWSQAEKALTNPRQSEIETFAWWGSGFLEKVKRGERVLMTTKIDKRKILVSPPGRVLDIRRYRVKSRKRAIIYVEVPKDKRRRDMNSFIKSLGPAAKALGNPRRTKRIHNPEILYTLGKVFA